MLDPQRTPTTMEILVRACLLLLPVLTFVDGSDVRIVPVGGDAILPCSPSTKEDLNYKRFNWMKDGQKEVFSYDAGLHSNNNPTGQDVQFKGRVSFFLDQLESGDASIIIRNTQTADSGEYTCDLQSTGEKYIIHLVVVVAGVSWGWVLGLGVALVVCVCVIFCMCKTRNHGTQTC